MADAANLDLYNSAWTGEQIDEAIGRVRSTAGSGAITAANVGAVPYPSGGADGQLLQKSGSSAVWGPSAASVTQAASNAQYYANRAAGSATEAANQAAEARNQANAAAAAVTQAQNQATEARNSATQAEAQVTAATQQADRARSEAQNAQDAKEAIENMGVSAVTLAPGSDAEVSKGKVGDSVHLTFGIPQGIQGETGPQGAQGIQGPRGEPGPRGIDGVAIAAAGMFAFNVNAEGHLILTSEEDPPPDFSINANGHLVLNIEG